MLGRVGRRRRWLGLTVNEQKELGGPFSSSSFGNLNKERPGSSAYGAGH